MDGSFKDQEQLDFNEHQTLIAVGRIDAEFGRLRRETIGSWLNERQLNLITVLGSREDAEEAGRPQEALTVTQCREKIEEAYGVSNVTADKDIKMLVEADLIEKASVKGNLTKKNVRLSTNGREQWLAYANGRAALILAAARAIEEAGTTPPRFADRMKGWVTGFLTRAPKAGIAAILCLGLTTLDVRAGDWDGWTAVVSDIPAETYIGFGEQLVQSDTPYVTFDMRPGDYSWENPFLQEDRSGQVSWIVPEPDLQAQADGVLLADGTRFLDENLPQLYETRASVPEPTPLGGGLTFMDGTRYLDDNLPQIYAITAPIRGIPAQAGPDL